jgi:hypothetical protein
VDRTPHKPREQSLDKFTCGFAAHYRRSPVGVIDMGIAFPTGWGQRGELGLDAAGSGFARAIPLFNPGQFRQGRATPVIHASTDSIILI